MNKKILVIIGLVVLAIIIIFFTLNKKGSNSVVQNLQNQVKKEASVGTDVCAEFPKDWVTTILGKAITKTEPFNRNGTYACDYFTDDTNFAAIRVNNLNVENQKKGQETLGRTIKTDSRIKMEHFIALQPDGLINGVYLVLNPNRFITIDRTSTKVFDNEDEINFATRIAERIQNGENVVTDHETTTPTSSAIKTVPLPQEEDIIRNFFNLIDENKISDAVNMLTPTNISTESNKQAWGIQFNAFEKISIKKIEPAGENTYKVTFDIKMKPGTENAQPIPYYGWGNGESVRWVSLEKVNNTWKVNGIATGP